MTRPDTPQKKKPATKDRFRFAARSRALGGGLVTRRRANNLAMNKGMTANRDAPMVGKGKTRGLFVANVGQSLIWGRIIGRFDL